MENHQSSFNDSHVFEEYVEEEGIKINQEKVRERENFSHVSHEKAYEVCFGFVCFRKMTGGHNV